MHRKEEGITLLEAIETLSVIADLEVDSDITVAETGGIVIGERRAIEWLDLNDQDETVRVIREIFSLIHKYVQSVYNERVPQDSGRVVEGIKTIMVLVGEAAKKLNKYTLLFNWTQDARFTDLNEYRKLTNFYETRIARQIDSEQLGKWILGLTQAIPHVSATKLKAVKPQSDRRYVSLDAVKKDSEYELFLLRKEDGTRFFNPQLIRNVALICDFGSGFNRQTISEEYPVTAHRWQDRRMWGSAVSIREHVTPLLDRFYRETADYRYHDLVALLRHAVMALYLSSNQDNIHDDNARKSCYDYFADFQYFLRKALVSRDYQRMVAYPPSKQNRLAWAQLDLMHALCYGFFLQMKGEQPLMYLMQDIMDAAERYSEEDAESGESTLANHLQRDYVAMTHLLKQFQSGPLLRLLTSIQEGTNQFFDPLWQHDIPCQLYECHRDDQAVVNVRIPCPVHQEVINKAPVNEEFKAFLRALKDSPTQHSHLIINLQDRTSWREYARARSIEELQSIKDFDGAVTTATLTKDSDFYQQAAPYDEENYAAIFIETFIEHLEDASCGFYFPEEMKKGFGKRFFHDLTDNVHRVFFQEKNVLTKRQRCDFIEITYLFLTLKMIDIVCPDSFTLMCKDGIDTSTAANVLLYTFLRLVDGHELTEHDLSYINMMLYIPALTLRERVMVQDRFSRMISALQTNESVHTDLVERGVKNLIRESFSPLFISNILDSGVMPMKPKF